MCRQYRCRLQFCAEALLQKHNQKAYIILRCVGSVYNKKQMTKLRPAIAEIMKYTDEMIAQGKEEGDEALRFITRYGETNLPTDLIQAEASRHRSFNSMATCDALRSIALVAGALDSEITELKNTTKLMLKTLKYIDAVLNEKKDD